MCQNGVQMGGGRSLQNCSLLLGFLARSHISQDIEVRRPPGVSRGSAAPAWIAQVMRTSYSLDLRQLLELLEDVGSFDLEHPLRIASTADGGMELYLAPADGKCLLQIDVVHGTESPEGCAETLETARVDFSEMNAKDLYGKTEAHEAANGGLSDLCAAGDGTLPPECHHCQPAEL